MSTFWKFKTVSAYKLKEAFPELKQILLEDIEQRLRYSGMILVKRERVSVPFWVRLTLPFALIAIIILYVSLPIKYMLNGKWGYNKDWLYNWFKSLGF